MTTAADGSKVLLGRGKLYFDRWDSSGASTGLRFLGECSTLTITPSVQKQDIFTHTKAAATKLATDTVSQTHMIDIQMHEYDPENVALALLGTTAVISQSTSSVSAEALTTSAKLGRIYQTAKMNISAVSVKKGATTGVLGVDFEIENAALGLIRILPTATAFVDGDSLTVDYSAGTVSGTKVSAGQVGSIDGRLVFVGDPTRGPKQYLQVWHAHFTPNGAVALITDQYGSIPLQGEALDDSINHPSDPIYTLSQM